MQVATYMKNFITLSNLAKLEPVNLNTGKLQLRKVLKLQLGVATCGHMYYVFITQIKS